MVVARQRLPFFEVAALIAVMLSGCAPNLSQRLQLVAVWPSDGASLPVGRHTFDLTFNAPLNAQQTSVWVSREDSGSVLPTDVKVDNANGRHLSIRLVDPRVGDYQLRWHAVATDTRAADGGESFALRDESAMPAKLDASQTGATDVDKPLDLSGSGFARNSSVKLTMGDDAQPLATADTDARGSFKAQPKVLASMPFGVQPLTATDDLGHSASTAIEVRWGGWPPAIPIDSGAPGPGPGQVSFSVSVRNRSDYVLEHVTLVVKDPVGAELVGTDTGARRDDQSVVWDIPTLTRGVAGPFHVTYSATGPAVSQAWMEFRHRPMRSCTQDCPPAFISNSAAESTPVTPL